MSEPAHIQLASARKAAGLSQRALSDICGLSRTAISRIENGVHVPRLTTQALLAHALRTTPEALFPVESDSRVE